MDNDYKEYETEDKPRKFKITRGMILLAVAIFIIIIVIVVIISIHNANKKPSITKEDYYDLERAMEEQAISYATGDEQEDARIDLSDMTDITEENYPAKGVCKGYVKVQLEDGEQVYGAYISCKGGYKTSGYSEEPDVIGNPPVITLKGKDTMKIKQDSEFKDPGATATDEEDEDLTSEIKVTGKVDTSVAKTYTIKYTVEDSDGNKVTKKRKVIVEEKETTTTKETTTSTTASTTTTRAQTTRSINTTKRQTTTRRQTTRKPTTTTKRIITTTQKKVTTPPKITLRGNNPYVITQGTTYVDPGFIAKDALGMDITSKVTKSGTVNTSTVKTYYITYRVIDNYGNSAMATRTVKVVAKSTVTNISITPSSVSIGVGKTYKLTALANYTGAAPTISWRTDSASIVTVSSDGTITGIKAGTTYVYATASGRSASCRVTVK